MDIHKRIDRLEAGEKVPDSMDIHKLIDRLEAAETAALRSCFLAPVVRGGTVGVRIRGVVCRFTPQDRMFEGWGVFRPISLETVRLERRPGRAEVGRYLTGLPAVTLIVAQAVGASRPAVLAHPAGSSVSADGPVRVHLVQRVDLFRHVAARFDGFNFWFERLYPGRNPATAAYLRKSLTADHEAADLNRPGLLPAEKVLYADLSKRLRTRREPPEQRRLRQALSHGGARLQGYREDNDGYTVTFDLDGEVHTSTVRSGDLTVRSAGICLDGEDARFDLQSLLGVLREARREGERW